MRCSCGKVAHNTKGIAEAYLHWSEASNNPAYANDPRPLNVYYCAQGKCWHVGHRARNLRRVSEQQAASA